MECCSILIHCYRRKWHVLVQRIDLQGNEMQAGVMYAPALCAEQHAVSGSWVWAVCGRGSRCFWHVCLSLMCVPMSAPVTLSVSACTCTFVSTHRAWSVERCVVSSDWKRWVTTLRQSTDNLFLTRMYKDSEKHVGEQSFRLALYISFKTKTNKLSLFERLVWFQPFCSKF